MSENPLARDLAMLEAAREVEEFLDDLEIRLEQNKPEDER